VSAIVVVWGAALLQGIALTAFPAAGNLFRSPRAHALTAQEYGALFIPMIACAVLASSLSSRMARRLGERGLFAAGVVFDLLAMLLLAGSRLAIGSHGAAYSTLLVAMAALGTGFGAALSAMNALAPRLFPRRAESAITALHATVGVGTAVPPLLLPAFGGAWWLFPLVVAGLLALVIAAAASIRIAPAPVADGAMSRPLGSRIGFASAAALYGVCEALLGNWGPVFLHEERALSIASAGLALSLFWSSLTVGRVAVSLLGRRVPLRVTYLALPVGIALALGAACRVGTSDGALVSFAAAGLGCSAFLPLSISFAGAESGGVMIAAFMTGSGAGSFGVGLLHDRGGVSIASLYGGASVLALGLAVVASRLTRSERNRLAAST
jgi:hypothetical protein